MLFALVDSMETTINNEIKSSPISVDFSDTDDECDSQDEESPVQRGKNIHPKPTPESGQSFFITLQFKKVSIKL